jgi:DNA polymerase III gamma/tau subunit
MRPERIKELRSSIRLVPELVRASMVTQAFELEKLITATIDLSDGMETAVRSLPQAYREVVVRLYQDLMYKAYDAGYTNATLKQAQFIPGSNALTFIRDRMPLPYSLEISLLKTFTDDTATYLKTAGNKEAIYEQFKRDIEQIYCEGATEYLQALPAPEAKEANMADQKNMEQPVQAKKDDDKEEKKDAKKDEKKEDKKEESKDKKEEKKDDKEEKKDSKDAKKDGKEEPAKKEKKDSEEPQSPGSQDEILRKLDEYAKLMGTPEGHKVMRYYLGLPVQASVAKVVGSYEIPALRAKVLALIQDHSFTSCGQW